MRKILTIVLLALANWAYSCSCSTPTVLENINKTDFIATAKILKITQDPSNQEYHDIEVELIDVYKGAKTTKLKIWSAQMSSCEFFTPVGTTWLIFANYNKDKNLSFHYCGGSQQIDRQFDLEQYPGLDKKYADGIRLKLEVLKVFRDKRIMPSFKTALRFSPSSECLGSLKGFEGKKRDFTVIEFTVDQNMNWSKIKMIKSFKNAKLSKQILNCVNTTLHNNTPKGITATDEIRLTLVYYFYPEGDGKSFVTTYDL